MSTRRKPRPLSREQSTFRDDRLFLIACDDTCAPKQYFDFYRLSRVQIEVVPTIGGTSTAKRVLERLLKFECEDDDQRWMLLDTDHMLKGSHVSGFMQALKEARQQGVKIALSRPCFELWLLLHHLDESEVVGLTNAKKVEARLRKVLGGIQQDEPEAKALSD